MNSSDNRAQDLPPPGPESLTESEARYRTLFEHAPDAIVVFDIVTGKFVEANENATRLFGYTREELLELGPVDVSPDFQPDGATSEQRAREMLGLALNFGSPVFEWTHRGRAGDSIECEIRLIRMPPYARQLVRGSIIDIRQRKAAEADLARRERQFRTLAENSPDWIVRIDKDLRRTYVNPAVAAAAGVPLEDLLGKSPTESFPGSEDMEAWEEGLRLCFETGEPQIIERETNLGEMRVLQISIVPELNERGAIDSVLSVTRDITSIRKALDAEIRLASIVGSANEAIMSTNLDGAITSWNRGAERMFGYLAVEVLGETSEFLFESSNLEARREIRDRLLAGEVIEDYTAHWRTADGGRIATSATFFPLRDATGAIVGTASIARDLTAERRTYEALEQSESRLKAALAAARMGAWTWDIAADRMEYDAQAAALYQRPLDEMPRTMRDTISFLHPDDKETARQLLRVEPSGPRPTRQYRIRLPGGDYRWISSIGDLVRSDQGTVSGILMDIHDRKLAEEALRESEARFRAVVQSAPVGIIIFDGENVIEANPAAGAIFGVDSRRLTEPGFMDSLSDQQTSAAVRARGQARLRGEDVPGSFDVTARRPSGETVFVEMDASTIELAGKPVSLVTIIDVTGRRLAEESLRASEARFRSLVDNSPDYITRIGRDLRHEFVNRTAEFEAGLKPADVIGRRADELGFSQELGALWASRHAQVFETGEPLEYEYEIARPGGQPPAHRRARLIPEKDAAGEVHHVLCIVTDITAERTAEDERRLLDQQMQHAQKLESLGVLAGGIAHDFNNLLVAILGNAGLALMELPPESPARQTVQAIETAAQRAAELTRQMLAYSGRGRFIVEPLNLSRVVEEMAHLLEVSVSKRATLKYRFAANLPLIEADATQIRQIIMNLIINSSDAIGERSGVISLTTGVMHADRAYLAGAYMDGDLPEGDYVYVEVADTGSGMDEETRSRVFDPFFTTKFTGRGLGLAAVLGIVRGHRGAIKLYSEAGQGTTFKVMFPAAGGPAEQSALEAAAASPVRQAGRSILVVDDDETVRTVTRRILERSGLNVLEAADGVEGIEVYSATPGIDLVLLDMTMPRMDGEETFRELRRLDPNVRVILTSGYNEQDATERFAGKGLAGFIQKPYRPADLVGAIDAALGAG